jgi:hypothetical protein
VLCLHVSLQAGFLFSAFYFLLLPNAFRAALLHRVDTTLSRPYIARVVFNASGVLRIQLAE